MQKELTEKELIEQGIDKLCKAIADDYIYNNSFDARDVLKIQRLAEKLKEKNNEQ